MKSLN